METRKTIFNASEFNATTLKELNIDDQARWLEEIKITNYKDLTLIASHLDEPLKTIFLIENNPCFETLQEVYLALQPNNKDSKYVQTLKTNFFNKMLNDRESFLSFLKQLEAPELKIKFIRDFYQPSYGANTLVQAVKLFDSHQWYDILQTIRPEIHDCDTLKAYFKILDHTQRYSFVKSHLACIQSFDDAVQFDFSRTRQGMAYFNDVKNFITTPQQFIQFAQQLDGICYRVAANEKKHLFNDADSILQLIKHAPTRERPNLAEDFMNDIINLNLTEQVCKCMTFADQRGAFQEKVKEKVKEKAMQEFVPSKSNLFYHSPQVADLKPKHILIRHESDEGVRPKKM